MAEGFPGNEPQKSLSRVVLAMDSSPNKFAARVDADAGLPRSATAQAVEVEIGANKL
jgi:hypothetical protein